MTRDAALDELLAKQAIFEVACRYARAVDRLDRDLLTGCYWPDGSDDHGSFRGSAPDYVDWVLNLLSGWRSSQHVLSNPLIEVDADTAFAEIYWTGFYTLEVEGVLQDQLVTGRYLDRYERRSGEWRIFHRTCLSEWRQATPVATHWRDAAARNPNLGRRGPADRLYRLRDIGVELRDPVGAG